MIIVAVEGDTDVVLVRHLCEGAGLEVRTPLIGRTGKVALDAKIPGFAKAGIGSPHVIVRDLDRDEDCPGAWIAKHRPPDAGRFFVLRLAVRAIESWFLADTAHAANSLAVPEHRIPTNPDGEKDPKLTIVNLARASTKRTVRREIVPVRGGSRKTGPGYEGWLIGASERWSLERALPRSPSLERAYAGLKRLSADWNAQTS